MSWLEELVSFAHGQLDARCRGELLGRGVSPEQVALFRIGYLNGTPPVGDEGFLAWCRKASKHVHDVFVLPLTNTLGEVRGIQVRAVDKARKGYREYSLPTAEPVLFGLGQAAEALWRTEEIVVVEGAFDLFPLQRLIPQTVATLTARVPDSLIPTLYRVVRRIWLGYDMDATGARGARRFEEQCGSDFDLRRLKFPGARLSDGRAAKDPGEVWEAWGDVQLDHYLKRCMEA